MQSAHPKLYSISEAARQLGVHPETLRRWERSGKIKTVRTLSGYRVFSGEDILRLKIGLTLDSTAQIIEKAPQNVPNNVQQPSSKPYTTLNSFRIKLARINFSNVITPKFSYKSGVFSLMVLIFVVSNAVTVYTLSNFTPLPNILVKEVKGKYKEISKVAKNYSQVLSENIVDGGPLLFSFVFQEYQKLSQNLSTVKDQRIKQTEKVALKAKEVVLAEQSNINDYLAINGLVTGQTISPTNLIINSSFEGGISGFTIIGQSTDANTKVVNESIRTGTLALKMRDDFCIGCQLGISQTKVNTINGRSYVFSMYVRTISLLGNPKLRIGLFGTVSTSDPLYLSQPANYLSYSQDRYEDHSLSGLPENEWIRITSTFENLPLGKYPLVQVIDNQGGAIYIDDLSLNEKVSEEEFALGMNTFNFPIEENNIKIGSNTISTDAFGNLSTSGNISAATITLSGTLTNSGSGTFSSLTVTGNINSDDGALQTNGVTRIDNSGNLTAGTISTSGDVTINGGNGKLTVGTIDPPYTINGEKYATFLASMTGVKEETTGTLRLNSDGKFEIDFYKVQKGSDLWLFYQVTNFGSSWKDLTALLTPNFDGRVWYVKDPNNRKLTIFGTSGGEVSYRLTAPRFDYLNWPNTRTDNAEGFILGEKK